VHHHHHPRAGKPRNPKPETRNTGTRNRKPFSLKHETRNRKPFTPKPEVRPKTRSYYPQFKPETEITQAGVTVPASGVI
jgi:hypothetical protein